jgi:radical SAM superfamily enzyme YgiQ (UPF0313 family)
MVKRIDPDAYVVVGGSHASLNPEDAISCAVVDAVCLGEADTVILRLADQLEARTRPQGISNFWFKGLDRREVERNPLEPFNEDLDSLPFIDREMWREWILEPELSPVVLIGRGCPNRCSYCSNHVLARLTRGRYLRFRSPANVVTEIEDICANRAVKEIYLEVETLGAMPHYALDFCSALADFNSRRASPIRFAANVALSSWLRGCELSMNQFLHALDLANIRRIAVGLESGSERIRNEVLRRPSYTNDEFLKFCRKAAQHNIEVKTNVMIGLPEEDLQDWRQTLEVLGRCQPAAIQLGIFHPYPGTDIYRMIKEQNLSIQESVNGSTERRRVSVRLKSFSPFRVLLEYVLCEFKVFKGKWTLTKRLYKTLVALLGLSPSVVRLAYWFLRKTRIGAGLRMMIRSTRGSP